MAAKRKTAAAVTDREMRAATKTVAAFIVHDPAITVADARKARAVMVAWFKQRAARIARR